MDERREEQRLAVELPWIPWHVPIEVRGPAVVGVRYGCRYCIALYGLHGRDVADLYETEQECLDHIEQFHRAVPHLRDEGSTT